MPSVTTHSHALAELLSQLTTIDGGHCIFPLFRFESMDSQYRAHLAAQVKQVAAAVRENAKNAKIPGTEQ